MKTDWINQAETRADAFPTALGWLAAAASEPGVLAVTLPVATEKAAWEALRRGLGFLPARGREETSRIRLELERYARGELVRFSVPVDFRGYTAFQERALRVVGDISYGALLTYGEVAALAGSPGASRAVGQAVHINRTPLIIPCHRVIGANRQLGGFGGGVTQKLRLLTAEGCLVPGTLSPAEGEALPPVERVRRFLSLMGRAVTVIETDDSTKTAPEAAAALGVQVGQIAKSLLFVADGRPTLVVTSGDRRVVTDKLKEAVGADRISLADPSTVLRITGFPIGGVAPVAHLRPAQVLLDESMRRFPVVYAAAGSPRSAMPVSFEDLMTVSDGEPVDVC